MTNLLRNRLCPVVAAAVTASMAAVFAVACADGGVAKPEGPAPSANTSVSTSTSAGRDHTATSAASAGGLEEGQFCALPAPRLEGPLSLEEAIKARRSLRDYTGEPVSLEDLGQLLWATQGVTSEQGARAAPSAGGTYPLELYVVAGEVTGLEPGVYRYRPEQHDLVGLTAGDLRAALAAASLNQAWVRDAALDIVITADYARTTGTYGERGVRYVHLEAGHAAQNLHLQAVALGLGSVPVGAFTDTEVSRVLRLPVERTPLYVIPVGHPAEL
jgi:SagB-type dehydrogenase family enzyme